MFCLIAGILLISVFQWDHVTCLKMSPAQQCILKDVSWNLKIKFLNKFLANKPKRRNVGIQALVLPDKNKPNISPKTKDVENLMRRKRNIQSAKQLKRKVAIDFLIKDDYNAAPPQILSEDFDSSLSIEENFDSNNDLAEEMEVRDKQADNSDISRRLFPRQGEEVPNSPPPAPIDEETDNDMKLKLFRLMYDTVKDNDELVHKADSIKKEYEHSNYFEIGFVMGAITDKVNTMSDVALTVERLYDAWKPIEHVNAYEQIANQAIEINHLIDILQSAYKKTVKIEASSTKY